MPILFTIIAATTIVSLALTACGPRTAEEVRAHSISKCESRFGRMVPDATLGPDSIGALCTCMVDRLAEEGLEVSDMLGPNRSRVEEVTRSCAQQVGVPLPQE